MVVYYDLIILINFIYQFGVFGITNQILHMGASTLRVVCASIAGCMAYVLLFVMFYEAEQSYLIILILSFIINLFISAITFWIVSIKQLAKTVMIEVFVCIGLSGILNWINNITKKSYLVITAAMALVFLGFSIKSFKAILTDVALKKEHIVQVVFIHRKLLCGNGEFTISGLIDSGNALTDPISGKPVCIMTKELCKRLLQDQTLQEQNGYRMIPYSSIGKRRGILEAFLVDEMQVVWQENTFFKKAGNHNRMCCHNVLFAVSQEPLCCNEKYEVILHPKAIV